MMLVQRIYILVIISSFLLSTNSFKIWNHNAFNLLKNGRGLKNSKQISQVNILFSIAGGTLSTTKPNLEEDEEEDDDDQEEEDDDDEEEEEENNKDEEQKEKKQSKGPIKVIIRSNFNIPLIDQKLELTASSHRDIASIKLSISRQMVSRPPISSQRLLFNRRILENDEVLYDLLEDDENDEEEGEEDQQQLTFLLDMPVPPIDPKFAQDGNFMRKITSMTTDEVLDVYIANLVCMYFLERQLMSSVMEKKETDESFDDGEYKDMTQHFENDSVFVPDYVLIKKDIQSLKANLLATFSNETICSLQTSDEDEDQNHDSFPRRYQGGAGMTVKRVIQKNLNLNYMETIRNICLCLFFGYFGTREQATKRLLYGAAPLCVLLQLRFLKVFLKQMFYTCYNVMPSLFLSLLPAPQQLILGTDFREIYNDLYPSNASPSLDEDTSLPYTTKNDAGESEEETDDEDSDDDDDDEYDD